MSVPFGKENNLRPRLGFMHFLATSLQIMQTPTSLTVQEATTRSAGARSRFQVWQVCSRYQSADRQIVTPSVSLVMSGWYRLRTKPGHRNKFLEFLMNSNVNVDKLIGFALAGRNRQLSLVVYQFSGQFLHIPTSCMLQAQPREEDKPCPWFWRRSGFNF